MRADDNRRARCGRLKNVVAASGSQRAAHENHIGKWVKAGQFAHRVQQPHAGQRQCFRRGAPRETDVSVLQLRCCFREAGRLARREDQQQTRKLRAEFFESGDDKIILVHIVRTQAAAFPGTDRAGGNPNLFRVKGRNCQRSGGEGSVILQVCFDPQSVARHSQLKISVVVRLALDQNQIRQAQQGRKQSPPSPVLGPGAMPNTAVHKGESSAGAFGFHKEIRPDLCFGNHQERGTDRSQNPSHGAAEIKWREEYAIDEIRHTLRHSAARQRGGGKIKGS